MGHPQAKLRGPVEVRFDNWGLWGCESRPGGSRAAEEELEETRRISLVLIWFGTEGVCSCRCCN
jgi:hypothetical protein